MKAIKLLLMKLRWISFFLFLLVFGSFGRSLAQDTPPKGPVYIVQPGDTLWDIAQRFRVDMDELARVNQISDPALLKAGDRLVIPGLEGIEGILETRPVLLGETLRSLSRVYHVPLDLLARLNHVASVNELYAGVDLIVPMQEQQPLYKRASLASGQSMLELALLEGVSPWALLGLNEMQASWQPVPGDVLHLPGGEETVPGALPASIERIEIQPLPLVQGKTAVIRLQAAGGLSLTGAFSGYKLNFFSSEGQSYVALQGIHAMLAPGIYPLTLQGRMADGTPFGFSQMIRVQAGFYPFDPVLYVEPATIDPEVTKPEDAQWNALAAPVTPEKLWVKAFQLPVDPVFAECWPSRFGNRRAYNDGPYQYFHTGLDFCGGVGNAIYAPASGVVVFSGPLTVRGNATMINHGWGIYSGYMHQSELQVKAGDQVQGGQQIGLVGSTGRVTGPHLHFEIWVGGVQVDPLDWLQSVYP